MKRLLVATDLSARSECAILRAARLVRDFGCDWTLLHVVDEDYPEPLLEREVAQITDMLLARVDRLGELCGRTPRVAVATGDAERCILDMGTELDADLVLLGPHRPSSARELFIGTTGERIIRSARLPVLRVGGPADRDYRRLLLALDLSPTSAQALRRSRELGLPSHYEPHVVYAFEPFAKGFMQYAGVAPSKMDAHVAETERRAREALQRFLAEEEVLFPRERLRVTEGAPLDVMRRHCQELQPDLLVIGTHGHLSLKKKMLGTVATALLREFPCDILTVPHA
ncbi:universal stress protein [Pseudomonas mangiferae]|uniref:Universal stress protein n=1 Tax=Pseudomonas mangiferae TaxID=2593654 RepID=A0A553H0W7_9PSED|nr:universal stress protein [Pseudomonas mangiferae]TRX75389.1 universal stress protein [Pseudomonas mangiferae]